LSRGRIIVLSGPSGVGKTTICDKILAERSDVRYSVSATSRPKRTIEKEGREYIFLSIEEFRQWIEQGRFVEYAEVYGNLYGTPKKSLEDGLNAGFNILMDVDVQGARRLMNLYPGGIYFYIIPPDIAELERRLKKRDTDKDDVIKNRVAKAMHELEYRKDYRYVLENNDLQTTVCRILEIIEDELGGQKSYK